MNMLNKDTPSRIIQKYKNHLGRPDMSDDEAIAFANKQPIKKNSQEIGRFMIDGKPLICCDFDDFNALHNEIYELVTGFEDKYQAKAKLITMNKKLDEILGCGFLMCGNSSIYKADSKTILDIPCQFEFNLEYDYIIE